MDGNSLVLETLTKAASQDVDSLKPAEQQLKQWESEPGFYSTLLAIFFNQSVDRDVRWLAVLYFKNGVDRYWRKTAQNAISEEEKKVLRERLISNFHEPITQLAVQLSVLISKVARFDCPREWPELVPTLLQAVKTSEGLYQQRALLVLHHVVKALSSKRLAADRRLFHELTSNIFNYVLGLWNNYTESFIQEVTLKQVDIGFSLEKSYLSLKILRKLAVHGFKSPGEVQDAVTFISQVFQVLKLFLECRKSFRADSHLRERCEKYLILLTKVLHDVLDFHPFSYVQFIKTSLQCAISFCFTSEGEGLLFERFIVQCFNLIKAVLLCAEYRPAKVPEETREPATLVAHKAKMELFTCDTLTEVCRRLLTHYMLLTQEDLEVWDSDPEDFAVDEGGEAWKFSLKPCTEVLFLSVFHEFRNTLTPMLLEMVQNIQNMNSTTDLQSILYKDAVYNAVGLAAFDLYGDIEFDSWFSQFLITELRNKAPGYRIIRRRVIWLTGQWVGVKLSPNLRPLLYETILSLLDSEEDLVVRLTAANALKVAVDDFEFSVEQFLPYLESSVNLLYQLLRHVSDCDTKMSTLHVLSYIIERMGSLIRPHAANLVQYLPMLWETAADHNMLRCAIITNLVHLVQGLGTLSEELHPFLLPVIMLSTDVTQMCHVYLLEDGLDLWWAVIENTSTYSQQMLSLSRNLLPLLELSTENLKICLQIIQGYVLLAPKDFLQLCGTDIVNIFCTILKDMRSEGVNMIMRTVEIVFRVFPEEGPQLFLPILPFVFSEVFKGEEVFVLLSIYYSILSRIILHNQVCFNNLLSEQANKTGQQTELVFSQFLDIWLESMPRLHPVERRKLLGLALTSLITTHSSVVHEHICGIFLAVCEVLNDIMKTDDLGSSMDSLLLSDNDNSQLEQDEETEHDRRKCELSRQDPVYTVALREFLSRQVESLQLSLGPSEFQHLMGTVDVETMQMLKEFLFR